MKSIYLDHASTTACDPRVIEKMRPFFFELAGNAASPHAPGRRARKAVEEAREALAALIGANPAEIVFTSGATESNNQAIFAVSRAFKSKGRHIVASAIEHQSVLEPLHQLIKEGWEVSFVRPKRDGILDVDEVISALRPDTVLVCVMHANNQVGTLQPVAEIGRLCHDRGFPLLVDATQTVGHMPVDVNAINCDYLSLSAHKFYGPQGVGALFVRGNCQCAPLIHGGDQERGRRAGTQNLPGIVGLGEAAKISQAEMTEAAKRESGLRDRIIDYVLKEIPSGHLNGHRHQRLANNAHFSFNGSSGEELISALDLCGVAVSMGSACTSGRLEPSHVLKAIGLSDAMALGSLRITVGRWTTVEHVEYFLEQLKIKVNHLCKNTSSNS